MIEHSAMRFYIYSYMRENMCVNISSRLCIQSTDHVVNRRRQFMILYFNNYTFKVNEEYSHVNVKDFIQRTSSSVAGRIKIHLRSTVVFKV